MYKMSRENFELRQDGWLKGKRNGAFKLPGGVCGTWHRIEKLPYLSIKASDSKNLQKAAHCLYIQYKIGS